MLHLRATCLADTHAIAAAVAGLSRVGDTIVLAGDMGAGKTAFAQGFGWALGVRGPITSPTFTLVHSYDLADSSAGGSQLHHADLYRLQRTTEVADLALTELGESGVVLVEWGDIIDNFFGGHLTVHLEPDDDIDADVQTDNDADVQTDNDAVSADDTDEAALRLGGARLIEITGTGGSWAARWERLVGALEGYRC